MTPEEIERHERTTQMLLDAIEGAHERAERERVRLARAAERRRRLRRLLPFLPTG